MACIVKIIITLSMSVGVFTSLCPFPWREFERHCYLFYSGRKTFKEAVDYCRFTSSGPNCRNASLISIADQNAFLYVRDLVFKFTGKATAFYMGGYTKTGCKNAFWIKEAGSDICTYDNYVMEVDRCTSCDNVTDVSCLVEKCMVANLHNWSGKINGTFEGLVGDYNCSMIKLPFVCEATDDSHP